MADKWEKTRWQLTAANAAYKFLKHAGKDNIFTLEKKKGAAGTYVVVPARGSMSSAWAGCVLRKSSGISGPALPWPLPVKPTTTQALNAAEYLRTPIEKAWRAADASRRYQCLEGDVLHNGTTKAVAVFRIEKGFADGKAFLVALLKVDLDGAANPGGSVVGKRL